MNQGKFAIENPILNKIWKDRYQKNNETLEDNINRVCRYVAYNENEFKEFKNEMMSGHFFGAGRVMSNAGIGKDLTLNNCFNSNFVPDSMEGIFDRVKLGALTHQKGGGIGYEFSHIRPKGSTTSNHAIASGLITFMEVFDAQTKTVMAGSRRGANMSVLSIYHPDIEEYITAKSEEGKLTQFNMSIMVDDNFMDAVRENEKVSLHFPVYDENGKYILDESKWTHKKEIEAKYLWDLIMERAYMTGEPGIMFYDNMNNDNTTWYTEMVISSNPCGEFLSGTIKDNPELKGACNLSSLYVHNFVENPFRSEVSFNYDKLKNSVHMIVRFLDNIIDINNYPHKDYEEYQKNLRTIGIGITGLADALAMMGIKYGSKKSIEFSDTLMNFISLNAYKASIELAKEKGEFPLLDREKFIQSGFIQKHIGLHDGWEDVAKGILNHGIRNARLISVAPSGTTSLTFGNNCSSGLEPIFSLEYNREVKIGGQGDENVETVTIRDYAYDLFLNTKNKSVSKDVFVTAMDLNVMDHIKMLESIAFHVDMSCSKTINVPTEYSFEQTKKIYEECWERGIKGCTIFRPNEVRKGIFNVEKDEKIHHASDDLPWGTTLEATDDLLGRKKKIMTGCGSLHILAWFDKVDGRLMEVYFNKGSDGGCNSFMNGLSRLVSGSLRTGMSFDYAVDQLKSSPACPSYVARTQAKKDTSRGKSCPDAIGNALVDMQKEIFDELGIYDEEEYTKIDFSQSVKIVEEKFEKCPECGETSLANEGGCNSCKLCGWSKCG